MDRYQQATQHLSAELTTLTDPYQVAGAVERTVHRWLSCERVELRASGTDTEAPPPSSVALASAKPAGGALALPACFQGRNIGWLLIEPKPDGPPFTREDLDLLRTIADQAALALAHAIRCAELEKRQKEQLAAWQTERIALVETVAAEIAHEVRYPINFFRSVFRRDKRNARLDEELIDIGCEEVERLERLVSGLRRIADSRIERRAVTVADLAARVETVLRDPIGRRLFALDVPAEAGIRCDPHQATQMLVNLVANAIDATAPAGTIGVQWAPGPGGAKLVVWDDGQGFTGDASRLFAPWFTTKPRGTGLGLAITQRIVRAHGWSIDAECANGRTRFIVAIPASDVVGGERRSSTDAAFDRASAPGDEPDENPDRR
jgi:signal transduction histidine kinase